MSATLLLVDDDEFIRSLTRDVLEESGYKVEVAGDGIAAWEALNRSPAHFDLVLLDKQMPQMDGIALLRRIKADARFNHLPVVMLTGANCQKDIAEGLAAGAYYYLTKPSPEEVLKLVISNALDEWRQKRELRAQLGQQKCNLDLLQRAEFRYRTLTEARNLALLLADASRNPERTLNGYSELLINAVEHGNLGITYAEKSALMSQGCWGEEVETRLRHPDYAGRTVEVVLENTLEHVRVTITDQGEGFDWQAYVEFQPERAFDLHGRGIAMSRAISFDSLEYLGRGNSVVTSVRIPRH